MNGDSLRAGLLSDLKAVEKRIRADLLAQYRADPALMARAMQRLRDEESAASDSAKWLETFAGRGAVLYILKTLYVRVLEDQGLLQPIRIRDGGTYADFRSLFPQLGHGAYLRRVFTDAERALPELFAPTPVEIAMPSDQSATALWNVWQQTAQGGGPLYDFRNALDTRFIGDLYQDLDPDVRERYALLQTPEFVEEFILDKTLEPALARFGLDAFRIIDPTCGSGHFLVGAFDRLVRYWRTILGEEPEARWEASTRAVAAVYGADLNEYACAISRFRLILAIVKQTQVTDLVKLRTLKLNVITCDSLIPWERIQTEMLAGITNPWLGSYGDDLERTRNETFFSTDFHAVVGNPPYINEKDKKRRSDYRLLWPNSARENYSLCAPMTERFMTLPLTGGFTGMINAKSFLNREFGKGVIERVLSRLRIDAVIDTSGASIPGHNTPTIILFGQNSPSDENSKTIIISSLRGTASDYADPKNGPVWQAILKNFGASSFENEWIAVQQVRSSTLKKHPWTLGTDFQNAIMRKLDCYPTVGSLQAKSGRAASLLEDQAFTRRYKGKLELKALISGVDIRDWQKNVPQTLCIYPYRGGQLVDETAASADLWALRTTLKHRQTFAGSFEQNGKAWFGFERHHPDRMTAGVQRIILGEIGSNSQFVIDESDDLFGRSAPVITLPARNSHFIEIIVATLNSSTLEFWFKSRCSIKNGWGEDWEIQYVRNGKNLLAAPLPISDDNVTALSELCNITRKLFRTLQELNNILPASLFLNGKTSQSEIAYANTRAISLRAKLVGLQEEIDWRIYAAFRLVDDSILLLNELDSVEIQRGHRPFEISLARSVENGDAETDWFQRHGIIPTTSIPECYDGKLRAVLNQRLALIAENPVIALLERTVNKRRWNFEQWDDLVAEAAEEHILQAMEVIIRGSETALTVGDFVAGIQVQEGYTEIAAFARSVNDAGLADTVARLLGRESVPDNPAKLFSASGLAKFVGSLTAFVGGTGTLPPTVPFAPGESVDWKRVWRLQEREDSGETVEIALPPPFKPDDYSHPNGWRLRGKFNIANERFIIYDELEPLRYAWGGCTTSERARLSADAFDRRGRQTEGGGLSSAPEQPTTDRPERCGIQFPLWEKLDELRRLDDPVYEDVRELASICGRTCPCDVLAVWRERTQKRRGKAAKPVAHSAGAKPVVAVAEIADLDPQVLDRLEAVIRASGDAGISAAILEPHVEGDRDLLRRALDSLRTDGRIEAMGRGRGTRYRVPTNRLF